MNNPSQPTRPVAPPRNTDDVSPPLCSEGAYLSTAEVGSRLRFHIESVRRMIRDGRLPAIRIGKHLRVPRAEMEAYESAHRCRLPARGPMEGGRS